VLVVEPELVPHATRIELMRNHVNVRFREFTLPAFCAGLGRLDSHDVSIDYASFRELIVEFRPHGRALRNLNAA